MELVGLPAPTATPPTTTIQMASAAPHRDTDVRAEGDRSIPPHLRAQSSPKNINTRLFDVLTPAYQHPGE